MKFLILLLLPLSLQAAEYSYEVCAKENGMCLLSGSNLVRYGAQGKFVEKTLTGNVNCSNSVFGDPIYGVLKECAVRKEVSQWTKCASENGKCQFTGTQNVRYGAQNKFVMKSLVGPVNCSNAVFGDPIYGVVKECFLMGSAPVVPDATVSITAPVNGSSPQVNASLNVTANAANAVKVSLYANGALICEKSAAPYSCPYKAPASAQSVTIKAVAVNSVQKSAEHSVTISVKAAPVVTADVPVYSGCEAPSKYTRKVVLDGNLGETLQDAIGKGLVLPGDEVVLKGPQKSLMMTKYSHPKWVDTNAWIKVDGKDAVFESFDLRDVGRMHFSNLTITNMTKVMFKLASAHDIILSDSKIYGALDSSSWTADQWLNVTNAITSDNATCVSLVRNKIMNARFGISFATRGTTVDTAVIRGLALDNELRNLSGDFIRINGSELLVKGTKAYDGYLSSADGDLNHDDFIQGFALNGVPYDNVQIIDNYFQETTNPNRKFNADFQGICVFDGIYSNYVVRGNTVLGSAYHGISMYGGYNGIIENNTVLSIVPGFTRSYRIYTPATKGGLPAENITIRNNLMNVILDVPGVTMINNAKVAPADASKHLMKFDIPTASYDLRIRSDSPYYNKNVGDQTPN